MCWVLVCVGTSVRIHSSVLGLGILLCCKVCSLSIEIPRNPPKISRNPQKSPVPPGARPRRFVHISQFGLGKDLSFSVLKSSNCPQWKQCEKTECGTARRSWSNARFMLIPPEASGVLGGKSWWRKDLILSCPSASSWALPWVLWCFVRERSGMNLSFFSDSVNTLEKIFLPSCRGTTLPVPEGSGAVPVWVGAGAVRGLSSVCGCQITPEFLGEK